MWEILSEGKVTVGKETAVTCCHWCCGPRCQIARYVLVTADVDATNGPTAACSDQHASAARVRPRCVSYRAMTQDGRHTAWRRGQLPRAGRRPTADRVARAALRACTRRWSGVVARLPRCRPRLSTRGGSDGAGAGGPGGERAARCSRGSGGGGAGGVALEVQRYTAVG